MFEPWTRANAAALLAAGAVALAHGSAWPLGLAAGASFVFLIASQRGQWTPRGHFGTANAVTALRLALTVSLTVFLDTLPGRWLAALVGLVFALDGVDGVLARRGDVAGPFGAHFDMETDALLVLSVNVVLYQRGAVAAWILSAGLLRYLYVLTLALVPARGGEMPRSKLGRYAFAALMLGLIAALALPAPWGPISAALGTGAVVLSFARSFYWSYAVSSGAIARS